MTRSGQSYSDRAVELGEQLQGLYMADAWPAPVERRFSDVTEAVANLARDLKELEAAGDAE